MGNMCCKKRLIEGDMKDPNTLANAKGQLWGVKTKQGSGAADPAAVKAMVDLYNQCGGDVGELAKKTGSNMKLMKANPLCCVKTYPPPHICHTFFHVVSRTHISHAGSHGRRFAFCSPIGKFVMLQPG
ncbi:unnamed protein product [Amoebophrya sp. A120]|nr:unnamed protein product [Amoebophrya sp. A120]|eukprot:GSA120T00018820001.1